jgi:hypothetical protein
MKDNDKTKLPKTYQKPKITSEKLLAFAASCNGIAKGGRKATVAGPVNFCRSNRLNS